MSFIKGSSSIDLGDTPIENIFIDVYMPMTNGTFVQVYLLGYKYALNKEPNMKINNLSIAKHLSISLSDVLRAWDFWESKKIIIKHKSEDEDEYNFGLEFVNLKQLYIDNNYKPIHSTSKEIDASKKDLASSNLTPTDLVEANKVPEIRDMFVEINKIIARELAPNEKLKVIDLLYKYNIDPPLIVEAFSYSKTQKNVRHILSYSSGIIRTWYDKGIYTVNQLQDHLLKNEERYWVYSRVFKALGFGMRSPSESDMKIMDHWVDEFKFDMEIILVACESSSKTSNPNINYINSILESWHSKGVKNLEDIKNLNQNYRKPSTYKQTQPQDAPKIKTKFHLAKSRGDKYTAEELEDLVLNKQRKKSD